MKKKGIGIFFFHNCYTCPGDNVTGLLSANPPHPPEMLSVVLVLEAHMFKLLREDVFKMSCLQQMV